MTKINDNVVLELALEHLTPAHERILIEDTRRKLIEIKLRRNIRQFGKSGMLELLFKLGRAMNRIERDESRSRLTLYPPSRSTSP